MFFDCEMEYGEGIPEGLLGSWIDMYIWNLLFILKGLYVD